MKGQQPARAAGARAARASAALGLLGLGGLFAVGGLSLAVRPCRDCEGSGDTGRRESVQALVEAGEGQQVKTLTATVEDDYWINVTVPKAKSISEASDASNEVKSDTTDGADASDEEADLCDHPESLNWGLEMDVRGACSADWHDRADVAEGAALFGALFSKPHEAIRVMTRLAADTVQQVRAALATGGNLDYAIGDKVPGSMDVLAKLAGDAQREVRRAVVGGTALMEAFKWKFTEAWSVLVSLMGDADSEVRQGTLPTRLHVAAGDALQNAFMKKPAEAWSVLASLSEDADPAVRKGADEARVKVASGQPLKVAVEKMPNETMPVLTQLAGDDALEVRVALVGGESLRFALLNMPGEALSLLERLVHDTSWTVREAAAKRPLEAALQVRLQKAHPLLKELLGDSNSDVRAVAAGGPLCEAVRRLPVEQAQELMQLVLLDKSKKVLESADRANAWLTARVAKADAVRQAEIAAAEKAKAEEQAAKAQTQKDRAETEKAKADEMAQTARTAQAAAENALKWVRVLTCALVTSLIFCACAILAAWKGERWLTDYRQRQRDARVQQGIDAQLGSSSARTQHDFYWVDADKLRGWQGDALPHHQVLLSWAGWVHIKTWSIGRAIKDAAYTSQFLVVSHRWHTPGHPDPKGSKVADIQRHLKQNPHIKFVWMDFWSLPQWLPEQPRSEDEEITFKVGLASIFMLFIASNVLVLFDLQYAGRFWTSYELWLSLRTLTAAGLENTPSGKLRAHMVCQGAANQAQDDHTRSMAQTWATKSPEEAAAVLDEDDVVVTNQRDKDQQIGVLRQLAKNACAIHAKATAPAAFEVNGS